MLKEGKGGIAKERSNSLEVMSTFDHDENYPALAVADINLNDSSLINGVSGQQRTKFYCRAIHNYGTTQILVNYDTFTDSKVHSVRINSGATAYLHNNVKIIRGSGRGSTASALLNLKWIDRGVVDNRESRGEQ